MGETSIRHAAETDLEAVNRLYNHYVVSSPVTFDLSPITPQERLAWFRGFAPRGPHRLLVAFAAESLLGFAHSKQLRPKAAYAPSVETTIYLDPEATGRGIGSLLYGKLFEALRQEKLHRAYAAITLPNPASVALHERLGFRPIGVYDEVGRKFERWWSVQWFEKALT
jgi:phosphinothricin acetyltransferase